MYEVLKGKMPVEYKIFCCHTTSDGPDGLFLLLSVQGRKGSLWLLMAAAHSYVLYILPLSADFFHAPVRWRVHFVALWATSGRVMVKRQCLFTCIYLVLKGEICGEVMNNWKKSAISLTQGAIF